MKVHSRYEVAERVLFIYQVLLFAGARGLSVRAIRKRLEDAGKVVGLRQLQRDVHAMTTVLDLNIARIPNENSSALEYVYYVDRERHSPFIEAVKHA